MSETDSYIMLMFKTKSTQQRQQSLPEKENTMNTSATITRNLKTAAEFINQANIAHAGNFRGDSDNFSNIEISGLTLENKNISRAEFNFSKITDAVFCGMNFEGSEFKFTELVNVKFIRCKLERASFEFAAMENVRFEQSILFNSSFDFANGNAAFINCELEGAEFHHAPLKLDIANCSGEQAEFNYCPDLQITAENCDFHRVEFCDSVINGTLKGCILTDADFSGSNGANAVFDECRMRDINTSGAIGINADKDEDEDDDDFDFDFE